MKNLTFINVSTYGGMDWHDCKITNEQLKENGAYAITNPTKVITEHLYKELCKVYTEEENIRTILENIPSIQTIENCIENKKNFSATSSDGMTIEVVWNAEENTLYEYYYGGQVFVKLTYEVSTIKENNILYFVTENFLCPAKGVPTVSRFYHMPYTTEKEAEQALADFTLHRLLINQQSVAELVILDKQKTEKTEWYKVNTEIISLLETHPELNTDKLFCIYANEHLDNIKHATK